MNSAGGAKLGPEFTKIVEEELTFWKSIASSLEEGWWNGRSLETGMDRGDSKSNERFCEAEHFSGLEALEVALH